MKAPFCAPIVAALVILGFASIATARDPSKCDEIAKDVREAVAKDPSKVLMIVEDALVINETCACEIVKAAITASNADAAMAQQIVQTAVAVAPKMAAIIAECANAVAPGSAEAVVTSSQGVADAKNPGGKVAPAAPVAPTEGTDFGEVWATNIRGVYLIQPAAAGFVTRVVEEEEEDEEKEAESRRTRRLIPLSPAQAHP